MTPPADVLLLAVNGTLMRGFELNERLLAARATFVRETQTAPVYRLWSIDDVHPAMWRVKKGGVAVAVEIWAVPSAALAGIFLQEPEGLGIARVLLSDGSTVLGIVAEPVLCEGRRDISRFGGWRNYVQSLSVSV